MHNFEKNLDPIEEEETRSLNNEEFRSEIREAFADILEDKAFDDPNISSELPEKVREGNKAGWSTEARDALLEAAQEFGLGREEMEQLEDIYLQEEEDEF